MSKFSKKIKRKFNKSIDTYLENNSIELDKGLKDNLNLVDTPSKNQIVLSKKIVFASITFVLIVLLGLFIPKIISYNQNVPTYQKMEVVKEASLQMTSVNVKAISREVSYYTQSEETIIIKIKLNNPQAYEILSLKLNDTLYQAYQFIYGSNSEEIFVEFKVRKESGIQSITVDQIKYVQGTKIKNVKYMGDRTIDVAIEYQDVPKVDNFNLDIKNNSVTFGFNIVDTYNLSDSLYLYLYDGKDIVKESLVVGENYKVLNLKYQTNYQYQIVGMYDSLNGKGRNSYVIYDGEFEVSAPLTVEMVNVNKEAVSFKVNELVDSNIQNISIYCNDEIIKDIEVKESKVYNIDNLKTNTNYQIIVTYSYILNNQSYTNQYVYSFNTLNKEIPVVMFTSLVCFNNVVYGYYEIVDNDNVGTLSSINVYKDDVLVQEIKNVEYSVEKENEIIINIDNDGDYVVSIVYQFDLNDGNGLQYLEEKIIVSR